MSPLMFPSSPRTVVCACASEHGAEDEHAVPLPVGATNSVLLVAARATIGTATANPRATIAPTVVVAIRPSRGPVRGVDIMFCAFFRGGEERRMLPLTFAADGLLCVDSSVTLSSLRRKLKHPPA